MKHFAPVCNSLLIGLLAVLPAQAQQPPLLPEKTSQIDRPLVALGNFFPYIIRHADFD